MADYESLPPLSPLPTHLLAGALAGIAEHTVLFPIDTIKTRQQYSHFLHDASGRPSATLAGGGVGGAGGVGGLGGGGVGVGGVGGVGVGEGVGRKRKKFHVRKLWKGVGAVVCGAGPAHALYFATYEFVKEKTETTTNWAIPAAALSGACATIIADAVMNPFDVLKQRMQLNPVSAWPLAKSIFAKEGLKAFYVSYPTTLTLSIPFQSVHFATYDFLSRHLNPQGVYNPMIHISAGGIAGAIAALLTTPLDVSKTLLQTRGVSDHEIQHARGLRDAVRIIWKRSGWRGFFKGSAARMIGNMPSTAISWGVYEYFKWNLGSSDSQSSVQPI